MSYPYFFLEQNAVKGDSITVAGNDFEHLVRVLRVRKGETVDISDNFKKRYKTTVVHIKKDSAVLSINAVHEIKKPSPLIHLYLCVLKKDAMETAIQKTAEIGIESITPVVSARTVSEIRDERHEQKKLERWQQIAIEASKQCKRDFICNVNLPVKINDLKVNSSGVFFIALERTDKQQISGSTKKELSFYLNSRSLKSCSDVSYIVGPEGGFSEPEINRLISDGAIPFNFGKNILRSETAAIYFLSILDYLIKL